MARKDQNNDGGKFRRVKAVAGLLFAFGLVSCGGSSGGFPSPDLPTKQAAPQIFSKYDAGRDAVMADGWTRGIDMSGVSFDNTRTATLITPRHIVMAKHYSRPAASPVVFHDRNGKRLERKIMALVGASGDVMVGLLDQPVPSNYTSYPLPNPSSDTSRLLGKPVLVSDQKRSLFIHLVDRIGGGAIAFKQDESDTHGWGKNLVVGDSGNPSFLIVGNQLVLIETHTTGGPGSGPYYGDPTVQASIRAAVAKLDASYTVRTVNVP